MAPTEEKACNGPLDELVEEVIGKAEDLPIGARKTYTVRNRQILVINDEGHYHAVNGLCSHYNFPLEHGFYSKGKIRCPLHGACFNMKTGDIEDYPGFDSINTYKVENVHGDLVISTTLKPLSTDRRTRIAPKTVECNDLPIIVVGGGPAASVFVESARLNGCPTPIVLLTSEPNPPYDRVLVSKTPSADASAIRYRTDEYYRDNNITLRTNTTAVSLDAQKRTVSLSNGEVLRYTKLVLGVGSTVRKLTVPGANLENVHYIRYIEEANIVATKAVGKDVVCIGGSFIGMEIAAALHSTAQSVTVICSSPEPLPVYGSDVGEVIRKRFEAKGIHFVCNAKVEELIGLESVEGVRLASGEVVKADLVIAGIGVLPATKWLENSCVELDSRGYITVDKNFRTSADWVYAIGDAVSAPLNYWDVDSVNIQHFQTAQTHGQLLGYTIVGRPQPHPNIPFFWSVFFLEFGLRFVGYPEGYDEIVFKGDLEKLSFAKYYLKNNKVIAVADAGMNSAAIQFIDIFKKNIEITKEDIEKNEDGNWIKFLD